MPIVAFADSHAFDPASSSGAMNILALLRNPANYIVHTNTANEWTVELTTPEQGVVFVVFMPPQGGAFVPGSGSNPPAGSVGEVHLLAADGETDLAAMGPVTPAFFSVTDLIFETPDVFAGADKFLGSAGSDMLHAGAGADTEVFGMGGDDSLFGDAGDDVLFGQAGDDALVGGDGDDSLFGEGTPAGSDAAGNDTLNGGDGRDFISYQFVTGVVGVTVDLGAGTATGGGGTDTLVSIEGVVGSNADDVLIGAPGRYDGMAGLDGFDIMDGGGGDAADLISYEYDIGGVVVSLAGNTAQDSWGNTDIILGFEDANGSPYNDFIGGTNGRNVLRGLAGNDSVVAGGGDDWVEGAEGDDSLEGGDGADVLAGEAGADAIFGEAGNDAVFGGDGEDAIDGGVGDDRLEGGAGADVIHGSEGNDRIAPGGAGGAVDHVFGGDEFLDGGFDTLDYSGAGGAVIVQLSGYATSGGQLIALFSGIEAVVGSGFDDALIGSAANDLFGGGAGADWVVGGGGDDAFLQGSGLDGVDRLFGGTPGADAGFDTISYVLAGAGVIVQLSGYSATSAGATLATFSGIEGAVGSNFDDALIGSAVNNRITGGAGSDWLIGGAGDDWFIQGVEPGLDRLFGGTASADSGIDTIDYAAASAGVTVQLGAGYAANAGVTLATFTGIENVVGTFFDDALIGSGANNRLDGGIAGADWLVGGGGDDTFLQRIPGGVDRIFGGTPGGDAGVDTIDYSTENGAGVVVQLSGYATVNIPGGTTVATFSGIENAVGTAFDDALIGDGLANRLTGGGGADWLVGGAGADTFVYRAIEATRDSIRDFSQGQDHVDLSAIDAKPLTSGDDSFTFATIRHAGVVGEAVVTNLGGSSLISLYVDADAIADMTIEVAHPSGIILNAGDFVL